MVTSPPSEERFEELAAQVEYQGGEGSAEFCKPHYFGGVAKDVVQASDEAVNSAVRPIYLAKPRMMNTHTCSCGNPTVLTIGYTAADGKKDTYKACAVCDAVHLQPRFN